MANKKVVKKTIIIIFTFFVLLTLFISWRRKSNLSPLDISNLLTVEYQRGPEIHENDVITALLWNHSSECIVFPLDYGLHIYSLENDFGLEVRNKAVYKGYESRTLNRKGSIDQFIFIGFSPDLSNVIITTPTKFTAEIKGHLCDDESISITKEIPFVVMP